MVTASKVGDPNFWSVAHTGTRTIEKWATQVVGKHTKLQGGMHMHETSPLPDHRARKVGDPGFKASILTRLMTGASSLQPT